MARHVAKNIVAADLAERCEVQLAYAIGVAEPVSVAVNTYGTGAVSDDRLVELIREIFPLTPRGMIDYLKLRRPVYRATAAFGHFGRTEEGFTWEATNQAEALRERAGVAAAAARG
jgi:S-adenosylmethionine synthetase